MKRKKTVWRKKPSFRTNEEITAPQVRLVGEEDEQGVYVTAEAIRLAKEQELDLVEISPNADPPVCRIVDYRKFLYEKKKKEKEIKANTTRMVIKEIRFTPHTDDHDFEFKTKHAEKFLKDGAKVKAYVQFRGRSIIFKEQGEVILLKFAQRLEEWGTVETLPKLEGKRMHILITSGKVKSKN
ncbi:MAG: translation initiation factor IF-3 [Bacteroidetes bacterium]|nr:translation initiation factor IF-3 [Bacteroidota bacterium]